MVCWFVDGGDWDSSVGGSGLAGVEKLAGGEACGWGAYSRGGEEEGFGFEINR
jgi:hypothetical protein